jgi:hypothetical protein
MPFTLLQAGNTLRSVNTDGGLSAVLTLPTGIALATNVTPRFARFGRYVIVVNTPQRPLSVDVSGVVRPLTPLPPSGAVALSTGAAGTLTGSFRALQTYKLLDTLGNIISESDYGPLMTSAFAISSAKLRATFPLSGETVSASQIYRTTTNGGVYFQWSQVAGNTVNFVENDLSDSAIGLLAAPELGSAPDLTLIAEFAGRLWGVERSQPDFLRYTTAGTMYGWSALNTLLIPRVGSDSAGITALIPRRAALGVSRHNTIVQVTGSQRTNFQPTIVNGGEQAGCVSQETVKVLHDIAYWLGRDGVYKWDSEGIRCVSDGLVRTWFTGDTYFNRGMFWRAFAEIDPVTNTYNLFLSSAGSQMFDRWVSMDLNTGAWFGPHKTDAFNPSCAIRVAGRNQQPYYMVGSREGYLSQTQEPRNDWDLFPIEAQLTMRGDEQENPEQEKYYGELSVHVEPQTSGTLTITPALGSVDEATDTAVMTAPLTQGRTRVGRIGTGNTMTLDFQNAELNVDAAIYGYEVDPVNEIGRR